MKRRLLTLLPFVWPGAVVLAQESGTQPEPPQQETEEPRRTLTEEMFAGDDLRQEMFQLFLEVERKLIQIDDDLAEAGAGDMPLGEVADAGLEKLLRDTGDNGNKIVSDIDRILEIVQQLGGT